MEKSIEVIWKEGFLASDALVAPKLNNLYNQKSRHIIDKFKRMFKTNLIAISVGSFIILAASFLVGIPVMGILLFVIAHVVVVFNRKLQKGLLEIDVNVNSYQYITAFDNWLKKQLAINAKMARLYYPLIFLSMILGFWFSKDFQRALEASNQINLFYDMPLVWVFVVLIIGGLLSFFGGVIYKWDVNLVYGNVFKKLDEILADMKELRA